MSLAVSVTTHDLYAAVTVLLSERTSITYMTERRNLLPWAVFGVAVFAYAIAIINRSTLSSLGPVAQTHFSIDATTLATFAVIQLLVYALMQVPVGLLLDRFGPAIMIVNGGLLMATGQLVMATVSDVTLAIVARVLVGAGDACTFISVMRLLPEWFSVKQLPTVTQLTGLIGAAGQLVAVTPLAFAVRNFGWTTGFVGVVAVGLMTTVLAAATIRDVPGMGTVFERLTGRLGARSQTARSFGAADSTTTLLAVAPPPTSLIDTRAAAATERFRVFRKLSMLWRIPGVRLAFWVHFTSPFAATVFLLLWGTPFLTGGVGLTNAQSSVILSITVVTGMIAGLTLGPITSRFVEKRVWVNWSITFTIMLVWCVVLLWPGVPPVWLLIALVVTISFGGPASMISFEVARSHTPRSLTGIGIGFVNTAGFISALIVIYFIGLVLDVQGAGSPEMYTLTAFKWAFAVQIPVWVLGLVMIAIEERRTLRWMRGHGRTLR